MVFFFRLWILLLVFFPTLAFGANIDPEILGHCDKFAGDNWTVKKMCVGKQEKAKNWFDDRQISKEISSHCDKFAGNNWTVKKMCVEKQEKAKNWFDDRHS